MYLQQVFGLYLEKEDYCFAKEDLYTIAFSAVLSFFKQNISDGWGDHQALQNQAVDIIKVILNVHFNI